MLPHYNEEYDLFICTFSELPDSKEETLPGLLEIPEN